MMMEQSKQLGMPAINDVLRAHTSMPTGLGSGNQTEQVCRFARILSNDPSVLATLLPSPDLSPIYWVRQVAPLLCYLSETLNQHASPPETEHYRSVVLKGCESVADQEIAALIRQEFSLSR